MTANEMAQEFLILWDKITSSSAPGYTDQEISTILSKAEQVFFFEGFDYGKSFQETELRRKGFDDMIKYDTPSASASQTGVHPNGVFYDLPTDFQFALKEEVTTSSATECKDGLRIKVKPITEDEYNLNIKNPFKKPFALDDDGLVWRMDFSKVSSSGSVRIELITDGTFSVGTYHLRYLKKLDGIATTFNNDGSITTQINSVLPETVHRQIIDKAIRIASGSINSQEYSTKLNEEKINE